MKCGIIIEPDRELTFYPIEKTEAFILKSALLFSPLMLLTAWMPIPLILKLILSLSFLFKTWTYFTLIIESVGLKQLHQELTNVTLLKTQGLSMLLLREKRQAIHKRIQEAHLLNFIFLSFTLLVYNTNFTPFTNALLLTGLLYEACLFFIKNKQLNQYLEQCRIRFEG